MNAKGLLAVIFLVATALVSAAEKIDDGRLNPKFYYDLGPDAVDVAKYPKAMQEGYAAFAKACAQCHTLARPINSPVADKKDWRRFIQRMHGKTKSAPGTSFSAAQANQIIDFLAYDSKIRKLDGKAAFAAQTERLKADFKAAVAERERRQRESDEKNARQYDDHAGATPQPQ